MASVDMTPYVDLRIYDKSPTDIYEAALAVLQASMPDWTPEATNVEVLLLQALSVEVAEAGYTVNRLPNAMVEVLLGLFGVTRLPGTAPTVTLQFTVNDTVGYTIPANTQVAMYWPGSEYSYSFYTNTAVAVAAGDLTTTVAATGLARTSTLNGTLAGTSCEMMDSVTAVESVVTTTTVSGGVSPETDSDFYSRGIQVLQRMTQTLVIPSHFTQACLEQTELITRATTIDNYDPGVGPDPGDNPGNITVAVYGLGALLTTEQKADLQTYLSDRASANLDIHVIDPNMETVNVTVTVKKYPQYTDLQVETDVTTILEDYLSPTTWPWKGTLRYNELITAISNSTMVDYVAAMTDPAADVDFGIDTTLTVAGTIAVTVT